MAQRHADCGAIDEAKVYENVRPLRAYADLPERKDEPALRMGYSNRNFCTVVAGPVGLCLAVPLDRPCIFRTAYNAEGRQLQIVYDFAGGPVAGCRRRWMENVGYGRTEDARASNHHSSEAARHFRLHPAVPTCREGAEGT